MNRAVIYGAFPIVLTGMACVCQAAVSSAALNEIIVTSSSLKKPNEILLDPQAAIQPVPPADGAGLLKVVGNMALVRKGGAAAEPLFRGLGGSRLPILVDDGYILGGCGQRMDPPTTYITPGQYDRVIVTKGPNTVADGPGNVSGSVRFEKDSPEYSEFDYFFSANAMAGSFGREDASLRFGAGTRWGYLSGNVNHTAADDYEDGHGYKVHSSYRRNSQGLTLGLTPLPSTRIELSGSRSRGYAAYADRMMDGKKFDRDAWRFEVRQSNITERWQESRLVYSENEIDHVMDNYSQRRHMAGRPFVAKNPKRETRTLTWKNILVVADHRIEAGIDWSDDTHSGRMAKGKRRAAADSYKNKSFMTDQDFQAIGGYVQDTWTLASGELKAGFRLDRIKATYHKPALYSRPELRRQDYELSSGFVRYQHDLGNWQPFVSLGSAERAPDFWERRGSDDLGSERNNELDVGILFDNQNTLYGSVTAFASKIDDFILIDATGSKALARQIDASRYGFEADATWRFAPQWQWQNQVGYTWADNRTDDEPLPQTPPLELTSTLKYENQNFFAGVTGRFVRHQNRIALGKGNIFSTDVGKTPGFAVFSVNGGWKINDRFLLTAGIDNLFDKAYRESVSRGSSASLGDYANPFTGEQIYEPGRQYWLSLKVAL